MTEYFSDGYYHSMDREYAREQIMPIHQVGVSIMATRDAIQPLVAKIREGASKVEIGFMGAGKGSIFSGQITPETVSEEQRQAIREIAKVNRIELSTHATVGVQGLAGLGQRGFSEAVREQTMHELKRAIDFAADTAQGGAITVHTGEFPRPLFDIDNKSDVNFAAHPTEKDEASFHLVDKETGAVIESVSKNRILNLPKMTVDDEGKEVPVFDRTTGKFVLEKKDWSHFENLAKQKNQGKPRSEWVTPEELFYGADREAKIKQLEGESKYHMEAYSPAVRQRRKLEKLKTDLIKAQSSAGAERQIWKEQLKPQMEAMGIPRNEREAFTDEALNNFLENVNENLNDVNAKIDRVRTTAVAYQEQAQDLREGLKKVVPISTFAIEKSTDSIAEAGIYAREIGKEKGLKKDLFVAPENLFPEQYGAHPQELKKLILGAREKMEKRLVDEEGMSESQAHDLAKRHIRATMDIGHLNVWRKYFQRDEGETIGEANERFKKWMLNEIKDLNKHEVIGHVHITDNMGYHDEHLTPGQGTAPILEFVKLMKDAGVTDMIVEPGAQDPAKQYEALYGGWKLFGHNIYGVAAPGKHELGWGDLTYLPNVGTGEPPYFLFGEMAPSDEYRGGPFWSGLGLE